ncbi:uncharacterized protein LOC131943027 [Physella acuta]|uniref:uncharacterized protein LOC131943027 n=1 Tax=Physella acuta TaxID=109671 RepID=UPI0027DCB6C8|nr:uncharacterized protein LOC131943027 [Physella acuta]
MAFMGSSDAYESRTYVLKNVPDSYSKDLIKDYVEGVLDIGVEEVVICPYISRRALIRLEEELKDYNQAKIDIKNEKLEANEVELLPVSRKPAIVVTELDTIVLSIEFLKMFLENEFAPDEEEIVKNCVSFPEFKMAIVEFSPKNKTIVEEILSTPDHVPLPSENYHIKVSPFYSNFHDCIDSSFLNSESSKNDVKSSRQSPPPPITEKPQNLNKQSPPPPLTEKPKIGVKTLIDKFDQSHKAEVETKSKTDEVETSSSDDEVDEKVTFDNDDTENDDDSDSDDKYCSFESKNESGNEFEKVEQNISVEKPIAVRGRGGRGAFLRGGFKPPVAAKPKLDLSHSFSGDDTNKISDHEEEVPVSYPRGRGHYRGRGSYNKNSHHRNTAQDSAMGGDDQTSHRNRKRRGKKHKNYKDSETTHHGENKKLPFSNDNLNRERHERRDSYRHQKEEEQDATFQPKWKSEKNLLDDKEKAQVPPRSAFRGRGGKAFVVRKQSYDAGYSNEYSRTSQQDFDSRNDEHKFPRVNSELSDQSDSQVHHLTQLNSGRQRVVDNSEETIEAQKRVKELEQIVKEMQLENELLKKNPQNITDKLENISELQAYFLQPFFKKLGECTILYHAYDKSVVLNGPESDIQECKLKILMEIKSIVDDTLKITPITYSIISRPKGKRFLEDIQTEFKEIKIFLEEHQLLVASKDENILTKAMFKLKDTINSSQTFKSNVELSIDKLLALKTSLESDLLVSVTWNDDGREIKVEGIKDDVMASQREIKDLLDEHGVTEKKFVVKGLEANFLQMCFKERIDSILSNLKIVSYVSDDTGLSITYSGPKLQILEASNRLKDLQSSVVSKKWDLKDDFKAHEIMLITNSLKSGTLKEKIEKFIYKEKCLIITKELSFDFFLDSSKHKSTDMKQLKKTRGGVSSTRDKTPPPKPASHKLIYDLSSTCKLVIKPYGDITKENSDILVCVLGPEMDLRKTRVGQAFNKSCHSLWKQLNDAKDSNPGAPIVTILNPKGVRCTAICHVVLSPYNQAASVQQLTTAVQGVLKEAQRQGVKSVSFPALGCGKALQFPPSVVAQLVLTNIRAMNAGSFLNKVVLLAPDRELFTEFKKEAPNHFKTSAPKPVAVAASVPVAPVVTAAPTKASDSEESDSSSDDDTTLIPLDSKNIGKTEIHIITKVGSNFENLKTMIKKEMTDNCLTVDYFNQDVMPHWPSSSRKKIIEHAKKFSVWIEKSRHPKTKKAGFFIKGERHLVVQMKVFIQQEFSSISSRFPKRSLTSDKVPKRGTLEFMQYAAESDELFPSYWNLNKSKSFWKRLQDKMSLKSAKGNVLVSVDDATKSAIISLVKNTMEPGLIGAGADAAGLSYRNIQVINVERVENLHLFEQYNMRRKRLFEKAVRTGKICPDIGKLQGSKGRVRTTELLDDSLKKELYYEINEHYLFHGTKSEYVDTLINYGFDPRLSSEGGMFGRGIYAAEKVTKSDQYTDPRSQRVQNGTPLKLFLTRMLLGNVFLCDSNHKSVASKDSKKLSRPPCTHCFQDVCKCKPQVLFDSVMGDGKWNFREFVVYDASECYPEYVITYKRV